MKYYIYLYLIVNIHPLDAFLLIPINLLRVHSPDVVLGPDSPPGHHPPRLRRRPPRPGTKHRGLPRRPRAWMSLDEGSTNSWYSSGKESPHFLKPPCWGKSKMLFLVEFCEDSFRFMGFEVRFDHEIYGCHDVI